MLKLIRFSADTRNLRDIYDRTNTRATIARLRARLMNVYLGVYTVRFSRPPGPGIIAINFPRVFIRQISADKERLATINRIYYRLLKIWRTI